jgi:hypothetical protein
MLITNLTLAVPSKRRCGNDGRANHDCRPGVDGRVLNYEQLLGTPIVPSAPVAYGLDAKSPPPERRLMPSRSRPGEVDGEYGLPAWSRSSRSQVASSFPSTLTRPIAGAGLAARTRMPN